jgi:hypothetical protein
MKSAIRQSRADGSTRRKVLQAIWLGWQPGVSPAKLIRASARQRRLIRANGGAQ